MNAVNRVSSAGIAGLTILVVDDEAPYRRAVGRVLAGSTATVVEAANGKEAVAYAARNSVDVVVMDVRMPVRDGVDAAADLLALPTPPSILLMSAEDPPPGLLALGVSFLPKPFSVDELHLAIHQARAGRALPRDSP
ncbi:MAG: response regulator [Deltaproteobacteria bacterium]|nr:response regulator [Deltaproteobacteria bacterium]